MSIPSYFISSNFFVAVNVPAWMRQKYLPETSLEASNAAVYLPGCLTSFTNVAASRPTMSNARNVTKHCDSAAISYLIVVSTLAWL
jgi:hypothetical protein